MWYKTCRTLLFLSCFHSTTMSQEREPVETDNAALASLFKEDLETIFRECPKGKTPGELKAWAVDFRQALVSSFPLSSSYVSLTWRQAEYTDLVSVRDDDVRGWVADVAAHLAGHGRAEWLSDLGPELMPRAASVAARLDRERAEVAAKTKEREEDEQRREIEREAASTMTAGSPVPAVEVEDEAARALRLRKAKVDLRKGLITRGAFMEIFGFGGGSSSPAAAVESREEGKSKGKAKEVFDGVAVPRRRLQVVDDSDEEVVITGVRAAQYLDDEGPATSAGKAKARPKPTPKGKGKVAVVAEEDGPSRKKRRVASREPTPDGCRDRSEKVRVCFYVRLSSSVKRHLVLPLHRVHRFATVPRRRRFGAVPQMREGQETVRFVRRRFAQGPRAEAEGREGVGVGRGVVARRAVRSTDHSCSGTCLCDSRGARDVGRRP